MSLLRRGLGDTNGQLVPQRGSGRSGSVNVTSDSALRHSAVWAAIRLRSDLVSMMPIDCYRKVPGAGINVAVATPPVLVTPSSHGDGQPMDITEWMASTQTDLDRIGNCFGLITARDGAGLPAQIEPRSADEVTVVVRKGQIQKYRIGRTDYVPRDVWHERQHVLPGMHVGLSPVAYAAAAIGGYLAAQQFALDWFANGAVPGAILKNTEKSVSPEEARIGKARFLATVKSGEPFVTGKDWDYKMIQAVAAESAFIEEMNYSIGDMARFFGVPGDMIDAPVQGSSVTYANVTQRNLQLLIMHLGAPVQRRERAVSRILPQPRFVKLNSDAVLRMDPQQRSAILLSQVTGKLRTPSEARGLDNLPPFTPEQIAEMTELQILSDRSPAKTAPGGTS